MMKGLFSHPAMRFFLAGMFLLLLVFPQACRKKNMNPTPQLASGQAFVLPSDSAIDKFREKPVPAWAAKKYGYKAASTRAWDLLHTRLEVSFDWSKQHLIGKATLEMEPWFYPQKTIVLDAKGFDIRQVEWLSGKNKISFTQNYNGRKLTLTSETPFLKGQKVKITIEYTAKPNELTAGGSAAITKDIGLYFINPEGKDTTMPRQVWTQGEAESSSCWFPTFDTPNEKCTQEMLITVEEKFKTLSNGLLTSSKSTGNGQRTDVWEMKLPHSPYLFMLAAGNFARVQDKWRNIPVNYWVEPKYEKYAKAIFGQTPAMMEYFSRKLGFDYPWPKYDQIVVRNFVSGAMENTTASVFMESLQCTDRELADKNWEDIIAHELFHQWFGDLVTIESWANLPLNESFANYSQFLWDEYRFGSDEADYQAWKEKNQYFFEAGRKREPLIRYYHKNPDDMFDSHSYAKGGRILHFLRKVMGDEAFFESLKTYLHDNAFKNTEIHHLRLAFEKVTGQDLNWFFDAWFLSAGHPELEITEKKNGSELVLEVSQDQDSLYAPVYRLPVSLEIWTDKGCESHTIEINKAKQTFSIACQAPVKFVLFDSDSRLPAEVRFSRNAADWAAQYAFASAAIHRYEALQQLKANFFDEPATLPVMKKALQDSFWACRQLACEYFEDGEKEKIRVNPEELIPLALKDPKSLVRAQAIKTLGQWAFPGKKEMLEKAIQDYSISASSAAFRAYLKEGYEDADSKIKTLQEGENINYFGSVLSDYYAARPGEKSWKWFMGALENPAFPDSYNLIQAFAKYMGLEKDSTIKSKGLDVLFTQASKRKKPEFIIGVFQVSKPYLSLPGVKEKREKLKAENTNEEIREILEYLE
jgi:aminopeptidase N